MSANNPFSHHSCDDYLALQAILMQDAFNREDTRKIRKHLLKIRDNKLVLPSLLLVEQKFKADLIPFMKEEFYQLKGYALSRVHQFNNALTYFEQAVLLNEGESSDFGSNTLAAIGNCHYYLGNYAQSIDFFLVALNEASKNKLRFDCLFNIASIYSKLDMFDKSIQYFDDALQLIPDNKPAQKAKVMCFKGVVCKKNKQYQKAEELFGESLSLAELHQADLVIADIFFEIADLHAELGDYESGLFNMDLSLEFRNQLRTTKDTAFAHFYKGKFNYKLQRYFEAIKDLETAISLLDQLELEVAYEDLYYLLGLSYKGIGDFESASKYYEKAIKQTRKTYSKENSKQFAKMENEFGLKKKDKAIKELSALKEELIEQNEALDEFVGKAAHDMKEPLRMIEKYMELINKDANTGSGSFDSDYFNIVNSSVHRMTRLIDDLLHFARCGVEGHNVKMVDLSHVFIYVQQNLRRVIDEKNAKLILPENPPKVKGNLTSMISLFQNLIGNAIKYNVNEQPEVKVDFKVLATGNLWIDVKDNGIGIPKDQYESIFDAFKRLHKHDEFEGTGLGLATCKKIVDSMGGKIYVTSVVGKGSTFHIQFLQT